MRAVLWMVVACAFVLTSSASLADDWPQWLGPRRDGSTSESVAVWTAENPPQVLWRQAVGPGYSSPVIGGGRVYIHSEVPGQQQEEVLAIDLSSGKVAWRDTYERPRYQSALGSGPRATPILSGKRLFTLGINGMLTCYDAESGTRQWQVDLYKKLESTLPPFAVCCSPLVIGNRVIVSVGGDDRCVVALDVKDGQIVWQSLDDVASTSSAVLFAGGSRLAGASPDVVFLTPLRLVGLDPLDGSFRWEYPLAFQPQGTSPTPLVVGDKLIVSTQSHGAVAVQITQEGDNLKASPAWQDAAQKSYFSSGVAKGDLALLVTNTLDVSPVATITCLDAETGKQHWKLPAGYFHASLIRTSDDRLLVLSDAGLLTLLEITAAGPKELARAQVCRGTLVAPALSQGRLVARDDQEVICIDLKP